CMADEYPTQLALVAAGLGCAIVPRLGRDPVPAGVRLVPLLPRQSRRIYALWRSDAARRPAIRATVDALVRARSHEANAGAAVSGARWPPRRGRSRPRRADDGAARPRRGAARRGRPRAAR